MVVRNLIKFIDIKYMSEGRIITSTGALVRQNLNKTLGQNSKLYLTTRQ